MHHFDPIDAWRQHTVERKPDSETLRNTVTIGLAGTFTLDSLVPYLGGYLIQKSITATKFALAPYNQIYQFCRDPVALLAQELPDIIIILVRLEDILENHLSLFGLFLYFD